MKRSIIALAGLAVLAAVTAAMFGMPDGVGKVQAAPITITATATGDVDPGVVACPPDLPNGDFTISPNVAGPCGDGTNEFTNWTMDFTNDPGFGAFKACGGPLTSALLTLTLTPLGVIFSTDSVGITGAGGIPAPGVQTLYNAAPGGPFPATRTITVDFVTSPLSNIASPAGAAAILAVFNAAVQGEIPMGYQDDAIISFAKLELTVDCQSGPPAVGGAAGLVDEGGSPSEAEASSGSSVPVALLAVAAAAVTVAAGGWYARRRWLR